MRQEMPSNQSLASGSIIDGSCPSFPCFHRLMAETKAALRPDSFRFCFNSEAISARVWLCFHCVCPSVCVCQITVHQSEPKQTNQQTNTAVVVPLREPLLHKCRLNCLSCRTLLQKSEQIDGWMVVALTRAQLWVPLFLQNMLKILSNLDN